MQTLKGDFNQGDFEKLQLDIINLEIKEIEEGLSNKEKKKLKELEKKMKEFERE